MSLENLSSKLKYRPIKKGSAEIKFLDSDLVSLYVDGIRWMTYNFNDRFSAKEQFFEIDLAYGHVLLTGLGLGIRESILLTKPEVKKITVIEKNQDVIEIFKILCHESDVDIKKLEIINQDADSIEDFHVDCIFLDHFEHESIDNIEIRSKNISEKNRCTVFWYWKAWVSYFIWIIENNKKIDVDTHRQWALCTEIDNLVADIPQHLMTDVHGLNRYYLNNEVFVNEYLQRKNQKDLKLFLKRYSNKP